ncbi:hypothetical protein LY76DRAFT_586601 [Colletotrichum caudatum]|nr:hypothetical protein LY76DRAFT_586601 [Colletotrichum caudatum]
MLRFASLAGPLDIGVVLWRLAATWRNGGRHGDRIPSSWDVRNMCPWVDEGSMRVRIIDTLLFGLGRSTVSNHS